MRTFSADPPTLLRALPACVPAGGEVWLEASAMSHEVLRQLAEHVADGQARTDLPRGTVFPREALHGYRLPRAFVERFLGALDTRPTPEVCTHLHVRSRTSWVLSWYDVGDDPEFAVHAPSGDPTIECLLAACGNPGLRDDASFPRTRPNRPGSGSSARGPRLGG